MLKWKLLSVLLETMLVSVQDRYHFGQLGQVEPYFGPFGDSVTIGPIGYSGNLNAR
jgi:hypothetical protein